MEEFEAIMAEFEQTMNEFDAAYADYQTAMAEVRTALGGTDEPSEQVEAGVAPDKDVTGAHPAAAD